MSFPVNSSEQLFYRTTVNGYLCFRKNVRNFIIGYDIAKYLTTLTIIIDFAENISNSGEAMKQSENPIQGMIQHSLGNFFPRKSFHKWVEGFGCTRILFENKVSLQLSSRTQSHVHKNVIESHLFYRFLISHSKILKRSNKVGQDLLGKDSRKKYLNYSCSIVK